MNNLSQYNYIFGDKDFMIYLNYISSKAVYKKLDFKEIFSFSIFGIISFVFYVGLSYDTWELCLVSYIAMIVASVFFYLEDSKMVSLQISTLMIFFGVLFLFIAIMFSISCLYHLPRFLFWQYQWNNLSTLIRKQIVSQITIVENEIVSINSNAENLIESGNQKDNFEFIKKYKSLTGDPELATEFIQYYRKKDHDDQLKKNQKLAEEKWKEGQESIKKWFESNPIRKAKDVIPSTDKKSFILDKEPPKNASALSNSKKAIKTEIKETNVQEKSEAILTEEKRRRAIEIIKRKLGSKYGKKDKGIETPATEIRQDITDQTRILDKVALQVAEKTGSPNSSNNKELKPELKKVKDDKSQIKKSPEKIIAKIDNSKIELKKRMSINEAFAEKKYGKKVSKVDWTEVNSKKMEIGEFGERAILQDQRRKLKQLDLEYLNVEHVSKSQGDGLGYDIISYDKNGNKIYLEVKATISNQITNFQMTENEFGVMHQLKDRYFIARVYNVDLENNTCRIKYLSAQQILNECEIIPAGGVRIK